MSLIQHQSIVKPIEKIEDMFEGQHWHITVSKYFGENKDFTYLIHLKN